MSSQDSPYRIAYHQAAQAQVQTCMEALLAAGWDREVVAKILEEAERRLKQDPGSCGEPIYNLRHSNMVIATFCVRPFSIEFGTHEKTRTVLVRRIRLMSLEQP